MGPQVCLHVYGFLRSSGSCAPVGAVWSSENSLSVQTVRSITTFLRKALRHKREEIQLHLNQRALHLGGGGVESGVKKASPHAQLTHGNDLILHRLNKWREHNAAAGSGQDRRLIAQGFAASGGQELQRVTPVDVGLNNRLPRAAKAAVTEDFA